MSNYVPYIQHVDLSGQSKIYESLHFSLLATAMEHREEVLRMLGGRTPAQFMKSSVEERNRVYRKYLVNSGRVLVDNADEDEDEILNPEIAHGVILRQQYLVGSDKAGKHLAKEAQGIYYGENRFTVRSHALGEFSHDSLRTGSHEKIVSLIHDIVVTVDLEHICDSMPSTPKPKGKNTRKEEGQAVQDLTRLLEFKNASRVEVHIEGGGAPDGSDLRTQLKIKEISRVVEDLITQFGHGFTIVKVLKQRYRVIDTYDLTHYWDKPTPDGVEEFRAGDASFEDLMRIQIREWTREMSNIISAGNSLWDSLL